MEIMREEEHGNVEDWKERETTICMALGPLFASLCFN